MIKNYGDFLNLAHTEPGCHIYGPGRRFVVWFQGCNLACQGCWNRDMWSFRANRLIHRAKLLDRILNEQDIQGVTFLGGEPIQQGESFFWLCEKIRSDSDLTLFVHTGYEEKELVSMGVWKKLNELSDILAIGRYQEALRNINQQWIGSDNQRVIFPHGSREYQQNLSQNEIEIIISREAEITILGFPE